MTQASQRVSNKAMEASWPRFPPRNLEGRLPIGGGLPLVRDAATPPSERGSFRYHFPSGRAWRDDFRGAPARYAIVGTRIVPLPFPSGCAGKDDFRGAPARYAIVGTRIVPLPFPSSADRVEPVPPFPIRTRLEGRLRLPLVRSAA